MEYSQLYQINIDMHLRPFGDLIKTIFSLEDKYSNMEIILHNADVDLAAKHSWIENPRSMFILLEDAVQGYLTWKEVEKYFDEKIRLIEEQK